MFTKDNILLMCFFLLLASGSLADEYGLKNQNFIPWPKTVLQFKMHSKTIKAEGWWCADDVGQKRTIGVTINLAKDTESGVLDIDDVVSLTFKPKGLWTKGSNVGASLSSDGLRLIFDGIIEEDGGETIYEQQYLQVNDEDEVVGRVNWTWVGSGPNRDYRCTGTDLIAGNLNL
ncbi:hypothetical protein [Sessilibacter corallicola]|uniref:Uncharacterized protein n=1 Tax=Sessilibacter corallicola TaxID=2904075 RepID=A0ABQ0A8B1_9GAMM